MASESKGLLSTSCSLLYAREASRRRPQRRKTTVGAFTRSEEADGEENHGIREAADPRWACESGAPCGDGARPAGDQHHGVLQGVQRTNAGSQDGTILPVEVTIFSDKSFTFITKTPPAAILLKKEAGVEKGSGTPNKHKVGKVTRAQVRKIAELKMPDLNCDTVEAAEAMVAGAARSMGIEVKG